MSVVCLFLKLVCMDDLCSRYCLMKDSSSLKDYKGLSIKVSYFDFLILFRCFFIFNFQESDFFYFFNTIFYKKLVVLSSISGFSPILYQHYHSKVSLNLWWGAVHISSQLDDNDSYIPSVTKVECSLPEHISAIFSKDRNSYPHQLHQLNNFLFV